MKQNICYRFVREDMTSQHDRVTKWKIGKWNKVKGNLKPCKFGLHASLTPLQSLNNVFGNKWFIAEYKGKIIKDDDKFCATEMRLIKEIPIMVIKRFVLFCAKDCLKYYEKAYPNDNRISNCIKITELFLDGKATIKELENAKAVLDDARVIFAMYTSRDTRAIFAMAAARAAARVIRATTWDAAWDIIFASNAAIVNTKDAAKKRQEKELKRLIKEYCK